jgi:hypothetical protein
MPPRMYGRRRFGRGREAARYRPSRHGAAVARHELPPWQEPPTLCGLRRSRSTGHSARTARTSAASRPSTSVTRADQQRGGETVALGASVGSASEPVRRDCQQLAGRAAGRDPRVIDGARTNDEDPRVGGIGRTLVERRDLRAEPSRRADAAPRPPRRCLLGSKIPIRLLTCWFSARSSSAPAAGVVLHHLPCPPRSARSWRRSWTPAAGHVGNSYHIVDVIRVVRDAQAGAGARPAGPAGRTAPRTSTTSRISPGSSRRTTPSS